MRKWVDARWFQRLLEVIPGLSVWIVIIFPFAFAYPLPLVVAYFILIFNLYWFLKAFNIARHLINGLYHMKYNMRINWYERAEIASKDVTELLTKLEKQYKSKARNIFTKIKYRDLKKEIEEL